MHKDRKKLLENKEMVFKNGVKNIQAAAYYGMHSVHESLLKHFGWGYVGFKFFTQTKVYNDRLGILNRICLG